MKKEKFEKIDEEKLDDISGGINISPLLVSAYGGPKYRPLIEKDFPLRPVIRPAVPTIDQKISRLKELRGKLKEANGNPSAELLKEMLDLMKDIDDMKKKLSDV